MYLIKNHKYTYLLGGQSVCNELGTSKSIVKTTRLLDGARVYELDLSKEGPRIHYPLLTCVVLNKIGQAGGTHSIL